MTVEIRCVTGDERDAACELERRVFLAEDYPYDYRRYDDQSVFFAAFDDGRCVGALRLIAQAPLAPPIFAECSIWDPEEWAAMGVRFEELATEAIDENYRAQGLGFELMKAAYTSGRVRGVDAMGVIVEPERADYLRDNYHFTVRQIGDIGFKGWDCAPYVHVLREFEASVGAADPAMYAWLTSDVPAELLDEAVIDLRDQPVPAEAVPENAVVPEHAVVPETPAHSPAG